MDITDTFYAADRKQWRRWLAKNHEWQPEIWLVSYKKAVGKPGVEYNDAVEEALCFGWIDSIRKSVDENSYAQRYTPRRPGSAFSQPNKERLARMIQLGRVHASVLESLDATEVDPEAFVFPDDIIAALMADAEAWAFFSGTSPSYQRIRVAYVDGSRDAPDEFRKRLSRLVEWSARRKHFGYGIESYY